MVSKNSQNLVTVEPGTHSLYTATFWKCRFEGDTSETSFGSLCKIAFFWHQERVTNRWPQNSQTDLFLALGVAFKFDVTDATTMVFTISKKTHFHYKNHFFLSTRDCFISSSGFEMYLSNHFQSYQSYLIKNASSSLPCKERIWYRKIKLRKKKIREIKRYFRAGTIFSRTTFFP